MSKVLKEAKRFLWLHGSGVVVATDPIALIAELTKELEKFNKQPKET